MEYGLKSKKQFMTKHNEPIQIQIKLKQSGYWWFVLSLVTVIFCYALLQTIIIVQQLRQEKEGFAKVRSLVNPSHTQDLDESWVADALDIPTDNKASVRKDILGQYAKLAKYNPDLAGWIVIPGTSINYPVMSTPSAPEFYLRRNFNKEYSFSGTPFLDGTCTTDSNSIILYGHNMKNGTMFSELMLYQDEAYCAKHPIIYFDSLWWEGAYEVIGAFAARVYRQDERGVFRYYQYGGELEEDRFNEYLQQVRHAALYDTGVGAVFGDQLLTLITCSYHTENGRFVVVAKRTKPSITQ